MVELIAVVMGLSLLFWCVSGYSLGNKREQSFQKQYPEYMNAHRQSAEVRRMVEAMKAESEERALIRKNYGYHSFADGSRCCRCGMREIDYHAADMDGRSVRCPQA